MISKLEEVKEDLIAERHLEELDLKSLKEIYKEKIKNLG